MSASPADSGAVLFMMQSPAYVRNFESVLRALAARNHRTTVLFEERKEPGDSAGLDLIGRLCEEHRCLSHELLPRRPLGARGRLRTALQAGQDYLRYFDPPYGEGCRLRSRALASLPGRLERALATLLRHWPRARHALAATASRIDGRLGDDRHIRRELERRRPDVLIVTPMVQFRSRQSSWVRAARGLGIGTMLCVHSWDNLTNKGLIHARPDRIAVWNEAQRREAIELHGAEPASIVVTGAWPYEHWSGWPVTRSRSELCRQLGIPEGRPIVLYACSSRFIAEREHEAVADWLRALRSSTDPRVAGANVIVRPHPLNDDWWSERSFAGSPGVAVFPTSGIDPVDEQSRADYFDSISHADAVVGINTSALIESAIIDRPALAFPGPTFRSSQEELPHFRQLIGGQGVLRVSSSMSEHLAQLSRALADASAESSLRRRFTESFILPQGGTSSSAQRVVAEVEALRNVPDHGAFDRAPSHK